MVRFVESENIDPSFRNVRRIPVSPSGPYIMYRARPPSPPTDPMSCSPSSVHRTRLGRYLTGQLFLSGYGNKATGLVINYGERGGGEGGYKVENRGSKTCCAHPTPSR